MNNVMVDLETLGTASDSVILAIGACKFDKTGITDEFYVVVDIQSCMDAGLTIDANTIKWWMKQTPMARKVFNDPSIPLADALSELSDWIGEDARVWGNGAAFDNAILATAYRKCDKIAPWNFWNDRCYRTMKTLNTSVKFQAQGTAHNALDDAKAQAKHLIRILARR